MDEAKQFLVLAVIGTDRPGIVAQVTEFLEQHETNVEDSRMAVLGGEFSWMVLVSGSAAAVSRVQNDVPGLAKETKLFVHAKSTKKPLTETAQRAQTLVISAHALDHEGIVHAITNTLARSGANITSLDTSTYHAPESATQLFRMDLRVTVPSGVLLSQLKMDLDQVADDEHVDIVLREAENPCC